jgi:hypothetical protein
VRSIVESADGVAGFLEGLRAQLKTRTFQPLPVRERMIPKPGSGKKRRLGIPTVADRVVQASLKLMLEPILAILLASEGNVPTERTAHLMEALLGTPVPTGFVARALERFAQRLGAAGFDKAMAQAARRARAVRR